MHKLGIHNNEWNYYKLATICNESDIGHFVLKLCYFEWTERTMKILSESNWLQAQTRNADLVKTWKLLKEKSMLVIQQHKFMFRTRNTSSKGRLSSILYRETQDTREWT
jgi:hypothetical protein